MRDLVQQMLVWRDDKSAIEPLRQLVVASHRPAARVQALWTLELLGGLTPELIVGPMKDQHAGVRRHGVRLAENHLASSPTLAAAILALGDDADMQVQLQRAYTLGEWNDPQAGRALGELAVRFADNPFMTAAVLSSVNASNLNQVVATVLGDEQGKEPPAELLEQLVGLASALEDDRTLGMALARSAKPTRASTRPGK